MPRRRAAGGTAEDETERRSARRAGASEEGEGAGHGEELGEGGDRPGLGEALRVERGEKRKLREAGRADVGLAHSAFALASVTSGGRR
jgi:hypothetical protein